MKSILLVEDDPRDVELTLSALEEHKFASKVFVVHDGEAALDLRTVKPERDANARATYRDNWLIFGEPRREMGVPRLLASQRLR